MLVDARAHRAALDDLIVALERVVGLPTIGTRADVVTSAAPSAPAGDPKAVPRARPTTAAPERPAGNSVLDAKLLSVLRNGPLHRKTIVGLVKVSTHAVKQALDRLLKSKAITKSGSGRGQLFQIP